MGTVSRSLLTGLPGETSPGILTILKFATHVYGKSQLSYVPLPADLGSESGMYLLAFQDGKDGREITVFETTMREVGQNRDDRKAAVLISLGMWGNSTDIVTKFAKQFGGLVNVDDSVDDWVEP